MIGFLTALKKNKQSIEYLNRSQIIYILLTGLYLLVNGIFYTRSYHEIHTLWTTAGDQDFGYLLFAISFFYGLTKTRHIATAKANLWFLPALLLLSITQYIGQIFDIKTFRLLVIIIGWPIFLGFILGKEYFYRLLLPTMLVIMAFPVWYLLIPLLQILTVKAVTICLSLINIPIFIQTYFIYIPNGIIHIAEGCSGLKYFQSAIAISIIMNLLHQNNWRKIIILGLCSAVLAIIANWIRVLILVLVGHYSGIDHPLMTDHDNLGWVIFAAAALLPLFFIDRKLSAENYSEKQQANKALSADRVNPLAIIIACLCIALPALSIIKIPSI